MFQTKVKMLREARGYKSQQAFANAFGVAQSTVAGWESGRREPDYETAKKLAAFFNVPVDYLIEDECSPVIVDKTGKTMWVKNAVSVLASQYHISADVMASISGVDRDTAEKWIWGLSAPDDEEYKTLSKFFKIDADNLKRGILPFETFEDVQLKVYEATNLRFAAYRKRGEYTEEDVHAIHRFLSEAYNKILERPLEENRDDI